MKHLITIFIGNILLATYVSAYSYTVVFKAPRMDVANNVSAFNWIINVFQADTDVNWMFYDENGQKYYLSGKVNGSDNSGNLYCYSSNKKNYVLWNIPANSGNISLNPTNFSKLDYFNNKSNYELRMFKGDLSLATETITDTQYVVKDASADTQLIASMNGNTGAVFILAGLIFSLIVIVKWKI